MNTRMKHKAAILTLTGLVAAIGTMSLAQQGNSVKTESGSGLRVTTFDTASGRVKVTLPDDMAAGDTISGTVIAEPAGRTDEEKQRNSGELNGYVIDLEGQKSPVSKGVMRYTLAPDQRKPSLILLDANGKQIGITSIDVSPSAPVTNVFKLPAIGQTGRPLQIQGPFDGDSSNTKVELGRKEVTVIAESPRQVVVQSPRDVVGSTETKVNENGVVTSGAFRNLKIDLTAPKTSLLKGESTELHVQVSGLEGLSQPVNIQVQNQSPSTVNMSGGNSQTIPVQPGQVQAGGTFQWSTGLSGVTTGGFTIVATVPSGPYLSPNPSRSPSTSPSPSPTSSPTPKPPQDPTHQTDPGSGLQLGDDRWHGPVGPMRPLPPGDGNTPLKPPVSPEPNRPLNPSPSPCACDGVTLKDSGKTDDTLVEGKSWIYDDVDAYGNHVNGQGKPVDENGRSVDADGKLVNAAGQLINGKGELVDAEGKKLPPGAPPVDGAKTAKPMITNGNGGPKTGTTKVITGVQVPVGMDNIPVEMRCSGTTNAVCHATVVLELTATATIKKRSETGWPSEDTEAMIEVQKKKASHKLDKPGAVSSPQDQLELQGKCTKEGDGKFSCNVTGTFDVGQVLVIKFPRALIVELYAQRNQSTKYYPAIEVKTTWRVKTSTCRFRLDGAGWNQQDLSISRTSTIPGNNRNH